VKLAFGSHHPLAESKRVHRRRFHLTQKKDASRVKTSDKPPLTHPFFAHHPTSKRRRQTGFSQWFTVSGFGWAFLLSQKYKAHPKPETC
jgi:hypothetical protein